MDAEMALLNEWRRLIYGTDFKVGCDAYHWRRP